MVIFTVLIAVNDYVLTAVWTHTEQKMVSYITAQENTDTYVQEKLWKEMNVTDSLYIQLR